MPRGPSGIYTLPPSYLAVSGETIQPEQHNPPLEDIAQALTDSLPRSGVAPMTSNLQMGGNKVTNLAAGTEPGDAVRRDQVAGLVPLGTIATQNADAVNIDGGNIDGTVIGAATPAAGTFTTLDATNRVRITAGIPIVELAESDAGNGTHNRNRISRDGNVFRVSTVADNGSNVANDYEITLGASGATQHSLNVAGTQRLVVNSAGAAVTGFLATTSGLNISGTSITHSIRPDTNNARDLGDIIFSDLRYRNIFLTNAPNVSSDARLKKDIRPLNDAERRAAAKISPRTFTMNGQRKVGYIAQEIIEAMASEGLDAFEYGLVTDGETYGVDYDAIAAFRSIA